MKNFKVIFPTYKRWEIIKKSIANDIANNCNVKVVGLAEDEQKYKKILTSKIDYVKIPIEYDRNLPKKRNWILDNLYEDTDDFIIMMDDDVKDFVFLGGKDIIEIPRQDIRKILIYNYELAEKFDVTAFGFANTSHQNNFQARFGKLKLNSIFSEIVIGFRKNKYRYDEEINIREDVELLCNILYSEGKILKNYLFSVEQVTPHGGKATGGLSFIQNQKNWQDDVEKITKRYGLFAKRYMDIVKGTFYK